jgi:NADH-quinone oxidoreductase subunit M
MSIVVTAVYILRAIGQTAMGPLPVQYSNLKDADWSERLATVVLLAGILAIGIAPAWLNDLIGPATEAIIKRIALK